MLCTENRVHPMTCLGRPPSKMMLVGALAISWLILECAVGLLRGYAATPPTQEPFLRIDTDAHTAAIRKIAADAQGRFLATASYDKTVRIWDATTGKPLRVLRPPMGEGNEGKLFALAMSPDGEFVACGGYTGKQWDAAFSVYLFRRSDGRLLKRITGLPGVVLDLAFAADGRSLAVGLAKGYGIRVYDADTWQQIAGLTGFDGSVYGLDFDLMGRLAAVYDQGVVRLFDAEFHLLREAPTRSGKAPFSVAFSPDGTRIAIGYMDARRIDVFETETLDLAYRPSYRGVNNGNLSSVAWSLDGQLLCAGGRWSDKTGSNLIRCWQDGGKGKYSSVAASERDTILDMVALPQGGVAYCTGDPGTGWINRERQRVYYRSSSNIDLRDNDDQFLVSRDGQIVQFSINKGNKTISVRYDAEQRDLLVRPPKDRNLAAPVHSVKGIKVRRWSNSTDPTINGKPVGLSAHEHAWCAAVSTDRSRVVLGTDWALYLLDQNAAQIWETDVEAVVRAVNITANGQLVVAALDDGTIRWYRMDDGHPVLALFVHSDLRRWVVWTPSGYYDASIGADRLIGWHRNNGTNAAAGFFPVAKFRSVYYRPDMPATVLRQLNEENALQYAQEHWGRRREKVGIDSMIPPDVKIIFPPDEYATDADRLILKFEALKASNEPITGYRVLLDGRPVAMERGADLLSNDAVASVEINLPQRDCAISVIAENRYSVADPTTVKVRWNGAGAGGGAAALSSDEFILKPKLYLLAVGVSDYQKDELDLGLSAKDASDFASAMAHQEGGLFQQVVGKRLTDDDATKDEVLDGLDWLRRQTTAKDVAMIFISGHGMSDSQSGVYYYLPVNANPDRLMRTGVPFSDIRTTVSCLSGKVLLFIDTCYSGNIMDAAVRTRGVPAGASNDLAGVVNELASAENGAIVFMSSSKVQKSLESDEWGNGAFTKALLEGLSGKADYTGKGKITVNMLDLYISERVKEITDGKQTPNTAKPNSIGDFPIALVEVPGMG